jgi:hypothetical protein
MNIQIEDFKTGWFGISIGIKGPEIDLFIDALNNLKRGSNHFHVRSNYEGQAGVGDIEIYMEDESASDNAVLDLSEPIKPNR